jgi:hypothetical protein
VVVRKPFFPRCAPPSLSSKGESEQDYSGGRPPPKSVRLWTLAACRTPVGTAGAARALSVAAEAEVRAAEAVRPRNGSSGGEVQPSLSDKDESLACVSHGGLLA